MKRLQHIPLAASPVARSPAPPARSGVSAPPAPSETMWRSRRVDAGSDWMGAWVRKAGSRG